MKSNKYWRITEPTITLSSDRKDHTIGDEISFVHVDGGESIYRLVEQYEAIAFQKATATFTVHEYCKHLTKATYIEVPDYRYERFIYTYCADCGKELNNVLIRP